MGHRIEFKDARRVVDAIDGESLLDAAKRNGVLLDSTCGGNGSCHQCRVEIHQGREHFLAPDGSPLAPQHIRGDVPIWLACRGRVRGPMVVQAAPVHTLASRPRVQTLVGWHAGPRRAASRVGAGGVLYTVDATGRIGAVAPGDEGDVLVPRDLPHERALALGVSHLAGPLVIIDLQGFVAQVSSSEAACVHVPVRALAADMPLAPGAIDSVEWSQLKTRTVLTTVQDAPPLGLCTTGLLSCLLALRQAGMCDADWRIVPSRFTRGDAAVLVGPTTEAVTPGGAIMTSAQEIALAQSTLDACVAEIAALRRAAEALAVGDHAVITGNYGDWLEPDAARALGLWHGRVTVVPHAAALGAARYQLA